MSALATNTSLSPLGLFGPSPLRTAQMDVLRAPVPIHPGANCSTPPPLTGTLSSSVSSLSSSVSSIGSSAGAPREEEMPHINHFFDKFPPPPYPAHLVVGVIMTLVGVVAVVGNLFIIYIFFRFRSLRTPGNVFVPNLALADGMMALTGFPFYAVSSFKGRWVFGPTVCSLYGMCGAAFGLMSINTLAAIAFERYLVIVKCYPVGRKSSKRHVAVLLLIVWLNSFVWAVAPVLGWNRYSLEGFGTTCSFDYLTRSPRYQSLVMSMFVAGFMLPLSLIVYCYIYIIAYVRDSERHLADTSEMMEARLWKGARQMCRRTELRIARTVILTVIFFCVSWLPYSAVALIGQFGDQGLVTPVTSAIPGIMAKMSTMYNPVIYSFSHPRIKQKVWLLLRAYFPDVGSTFGGPGTDLQRPSHLLGPASRGASRGVGGGGGPPGGCTSSRAGVLTPNGIRPHPASSSGVSRSHAPARSNQTSSPPQHPQSHPPSGSGEIVYFSKRRSNNFFPSLGSSDPLTPSSRAGRGAPPRSSSSSNSHSSFYTCPSEDSSSSGSRVPCPAESRRRAYAQVKNLTHTSCSSAAGYRTVAVTTGRVPKIETDEV